MKVTIVHTNNKKQLLVSTKTMEKLLERIAKDDSKNTVTHSVNMCPIWKQLRVLQGYANMDAHLPRC